MTSRILVVDHEPVIRDVLAAWLGERGYRSVGAGRLEEALEQAASDAFDAVVLDAQLPDGAGAALARQLRVADPRIGVVMMTRLGQDAEPHGEPPVEGVVYFLKPFTRHQAIDAVERAVQRREPSRQSPTDRAHLERTIAQRTLDLARQIVAADTGSAAAIDALLLELYRRNPDAGRHARRVADIASALAVELGLTETELAVVERGALFHDIGKLAMPAALMCKPAALTEDDINLIRAHPQIGYAILSESPALRLPADIVLSSHEAWDGSGYPRRLARTAIPLGARITAVADTYDALTWSRALGEPVSRMRAAAELVRCAGAQFDPDVVHAWLRLLDRGHPLADALLVDTLAAPEWTPVLQAES